MQPRKAELANLNRNIEALKTILGSSVYATMNALLVEDKDNRLVSVAEYLRLSEAFNKVEDAIIDLNHLVHDMNGTRAEPEPHGSRDTFVPHPDGPDAERFNAMQD
jgi:hypothetical protein